MARPPSPENPPEPLPATVEGFAREELVRMAPMLRRLPYRLDRLTTMAERGTLAARVSLFFQRPTGACRL